MPDLDNEFPAVPTEFQVREFPDVPREDDIDRQPADTPRGAPPPELVEAVVRHYAELRASLLIRVDSIESILGFLHDDHAGLAERVAKIERFLGVKA